MKKFLLHLVIFFTILISLDIIFGCFCSFLNRNAKGGDTYNHYYIAHEMTDSALIFGSSRAIHHYNPAILEEALGMTVYNCGLDGNGIIYNYGRLLTILNRYTPKLIIYDVIPSFDMEHDDYTKYLQWQRRWYDIPGISDIFHDVNPLEDIKMLSNFYRYNTSFIQMLSDNIKPLQNISYKGYKPLFGKINYTATAQKSEPGHWCDLKLLYFNKFVKLCKDRNIQLIISFSPWYMAKNSDIYVEFTKFAKEHNLKLINFYCSQEISMNREYFEDASHLNSIGADFFTTKFAAVLIESL